MALVTPVKRAPWWQWALVSLGVSVLVAVLTVVSIIALALRGVDLTDYLFLSRPPYLTDGASAAWIGLLLVLQPAGPALGALLFGPARAVVCQRLRPPHDAAGLCLRLAAGGALVLGMQALWARVGPQPPEPFRLIDHLVYAVQGGGQLWPKVWLVTAVGVAGPVAEEIAFRGLLFGLCRRKWGFRAGALASALLFGLAHGWASAVPAGVMGLYLAYQAERDGTLLGAMVLHMLNNIGALVALSAIK